MVRQKDGETDERKKKEGKSRSKAQEKSYGVYLDDWEEKEEFNEIIITIVQVLYGAHIHL